MSFCVDKVSQSFPQKKITKYLIARLLKHWLFKNLKSFQFGNRNFKFIFFSIAESYNLPSRAQNASISLFFCPKLAKNTFTVIKCNTGNNYFKTAKTNPVKAFAGKYHFEKKEFWRFWDRKVNWKKASKKVRFSFFFSKKVLQNYVKQFKNLIVISSQSFNIKGVQYGNFFPRNYTLGSHSLVCLRFQRYVQTYWCLV